MTWRGIHFRLLKSGEWATRKGGEIRVSKLGDPGDRTPFLATFTSATGKQYAAWGKSANDALDKMRTAVVKEHEALARFLA